MTFSAWLFEQKLSDWIQGLGSLSAAAIAVGIALRQERNDRRQTEAARSLRRQVLAAAIGPVLRDMKTTTRIRNGLLQTLGRVRQAEAPPHIEELSILLPDIFMTTIERINVFGAYIAAQVYTLIHRVNDYNRIVAAQREWDVPHRTWNTNLRPRLDAIVETLDILIPTMETEVEGLEDASTR